jgi:hypothetical protein
VQWQFNSIRHHHHRVSMTLKRSPNRGVIGYAMVLRGDTTASRGQLCMNGAGRFTG